METFTYKNYKNCYFIISSYAVNKKAMAVSIMNNDKGPITTCTIYDNNFSYTKGLVTIKNYSQNSKMTDFLQELGVITSIIIREPCNPFVTDTLSTNTPQTIDLCTIDIDILKQYSKKWNYHV